MRGRASVRAGASACRRRARARRSQAPACRAAPAAKPAAQQPQGPASEGLEALEARLDRAVDRVSLPHAARLLGRARARRAAIACRGTGSCWC